jgi:lauroyl/myristoyl acyltransferase
MTAIMARIAPDAGWAARQRLVADVFRHFAMCFADLIISNRRERGLGRLLGRVDGAHYVAAAVREGRGLILMTAHLGNWELAGRLVAETTVLPTHVVVETEADPGVERFLRGGPAPVRFVARTHPTAALPLVAALRRNEIVAVQGDRALGNRGDIAVPFFGAAAQFPLGPFVLARAAGAPLLPVFCVLDGDHRYRITLGAPLSVRRETERDALAQWVAVLEAAVRAHPEQWFNFFDCWTPVPPR